MGYNLDEIRIPLRLDNHLGPETERDKEAARDLKHDITELIKSEDRYMRINVAGIIGGEG